MALRILFSPAAIADIEIIADYIFQSSPRASAQLIADIKKRCEKIAFAPRSGRERPELDTNLRSVPIGQYVIFYRVAISEIRIERILHGARDIVTEFETSP